MSVTSKVNNNISDLLHRVTSSCLTAHHFPAHDLQDSDHENESRNYTNTTQSSPPSSLMSSSDQQQQHLAYLEEDETENYYVVERLKQVETLTNEVFASVSCLKKAYVRLQEAHCPWDPERMRAADVAVVGELRRLGRLRDRFRRGAEEGAVVVGPGRDQVVEAYEMAMEEMRRDIKVKEAEIMNLKENLKVSNVTPRGGSGSGGRKKGRGQFGKRVGCITGFGTPLAAPTAELFETCMDEVKSASKSFTAHLLSLMRAAHWDIAAAARSIIENTAADDHTTDNFTIPNVDPTHAKHALESYVTRKIFHGFENETFYIEGSLTSLLHPSEFRRDCFAQFRDMKSMDPGEILGILPTCQFGKFAGKKYLTIVHPKMEESLFGCAEQRIQVLAGAHPRTGFYGEYLRLAKAIWLLHLLAFALDPSPSHFEASKGAEFHPEYMESVVKLAAGGRVGSGWVVGFSVAPGFKLGNGSVVKARVYLVPRVRDIL